MHVCEPDVGDAILHPYTVYIKVNFYSPVRMSPSQCCTRLKRLRHLSIIFIRLYNTVDTSRCERNWWVIIEKVHMVSAGSAFQ